ncbi:hypothetical protein Tco_0806139, partial [Tanacetum coccineum]
NGYAVSSLMDTAYWSSETVMAISVISVSSDSSEDSMGTPAGRVILFGIIPNTIPDTTPVITPPTTQTDTTVISTESDPYEDPSSDHISPLPAISPFLSSVDDTTDSDTPDTPTSPTHGTPFTEITSSIQRSPVIPRRRVMILAPGQPIPHGRPHSVDHSSSDYFSPDDSAQDFSSDSSSKASLDFHSDASSDSSPMTSVPALSPVSGALSPVCADLIPSPKRVKDSVYLADVEVDHRETSLRDDVIVRGSDEPYLEHDIDLEIQAEIDECIAYADALRDRGIDARVIVEAVDRVEKAIPVHRIQVIEGVLREQGHRIVGVESVVTALTEWIAELERDNRRLRGTASVKSQRVDRLQRGMSRMQRELRQIRQLRFYDRVRIGRLRRVLGST